MLSDDFFEKSSFFCATGVCFFAGTQCISEEDHTIKQRLKYHLFFARKTDNFVSFSFSSFFFAKQNDHKSCIISKKVTQIMCGGMELLREIMVFFSVQCVEQITYFFVVFCILTQYWTFLSIFFVGLYSLHCFLKPSCNFFCSYHQK